MFNIPCVIFAGGKSSRMGENKALLPFAGFETLTEYQHNRLSQIFSTVYISCKESSLFNFEANFIEDEPLSAVFAPTLGFLSVCDALAVEKFFALSVDTPFISETEISQIVLADTKESDALIAKTDEGIQPLCGIYTKRLRNDFLQMYQQNNHKLGQLLKKINTTYVYFPDTKPFLNMNHPQDYKEALEIVNSTLL